MTFKNKCNGDITEQVSKANYIALTAVVPNPKPIKPHRGAEEGAINPHLGREGYTWIF